jgi:septum formation protein
MAMLGLPFEIVPSDVEETLPPGRIDPALEARRLALAKARSVARSRPDSTVVGADTVVCLGRCVLGKPRDVQEAMRMLCALSGRTHRVITGIAVCAPEADARASEITEVTFRPLMVEEMEEYARSGEPLDKAGAYAIQAGAARFVARIEGCYYNVVGLPVVRLARLLRVLGVQPRHP